MTKLTVHDLLAGKAKQQQFTYVHVASLDQALAAQAAGIDMLGCAYNETSKILPAAVSDTHFQFGLKFGHYASTTEALRGAFKALEAGAQSIYCPMGFDTVNALAKEGIPVIGHIGLVPPKSTWTGGFRAVGKTAAQAQQLWQDVKDYENAGAMGVEIEVVPHRIASAISKHTHLLTISLGAGSGCDVQYLFSADILGEVQGRIPRHAKMYHNFMTEYEQLQNKRIQAYQAYIQDVQNGEFPSQQHLVELPDKEYQQFINMLESKSDQ